MMTFQESFIKTRTRGFLVLEAGCISAETGSGWRTLASRWRGSGTPRRTGSGRPVLQRRTPTTRVMTSSPWPPLTSPRVSGCAGHEARVGGSHGHVTRVRWSSGQCCHEFSKYCYDGIVVSICIGWNTIQKSYIWSFLMNLIYLVNIQYSTPKQI